MEERQHQQSSINDAMEKMSEDTKDVDNNAEATDEEQNQHLFSDIYQDSIKFLSVDEVRADINKLVGMVGQEATDILATLIVAVSTNSAFAAINRYSEEVISPLVDDIVSAVEKGLSETNIEVSAVKDAVSVLRKRIEDTNTELIKIRNNQ